MAKFSVGDRVRVRNRHPQAYSLLWERIGTVIRADGPMMWAAGGDKGQPDEQQYIIRFEGLTGDRAVWENWLEPAPSDTQ